MIQATSSPCSLATKRYFLLELSQGSNYPHSPAVRSSVFSYRNPSSVLLGRQRMFLSGSQVNKSTPLFWVARQELKGEAVCRSQFQLLCCLYRKFGTEEHRVRQGKYLQASFSASFHTVLHPAFSPTVAFSQFLHQPHLLDHRAFARAAPWPSRQTPIHPSESSSRIPSSGMLSRLHQAPGETCSHGKLCFPSEGSPHPLERHNLPSSLQLGRSSFVHLYP